MSVKSRIAQLNARLAEKLTAKGVEADASETTTALIDKMDEIQQGGKGVLLTPEFFNDINTAVDITADMLEGVTALRKSAFAYWHINSIELPDTLTNITNQHIFSGVVFPEDYVFILPDSVTSTVGVYALAVTQCDTIDLGNGVSVVGSYAIAGSGVKNIIFGTSFREITNAVAFVNASKLVGLTFREGATVGTQSGVSFKSSPLSVESAKNLINVLVDCKGTDKEYKFSCIFSDATKTALEAEGATAPNGGTWLSYVEEKGWNI